MEHTQNTTLYPHRLSAVTHGQYAVGKSGLYFKFDTSLNPSSVYGVMLRLDQAAWLDSFDAIICQSENDVWEIRKRFPKVSYRVRAEYDYSDPDDGVSPTRCLYVARRHGVYDVFLDDEFGSGTIMEISMPDLVSVQCITRDYR